MKHIRTVHENDPNFIIYCSFCGLSYKKWESLRKHVQRIHQGDHNIKLAHFMNNIFIECLNKTEYEHTASCNDEHNFEHM